MLSRISKWSRNGEYPSEIVLEGAILTVTQELSENQIDGRDDIWSVAILDDGKHVVSGGEERKIRRWRVKDGKEVEKPMTAWSTVRNIAVSQDGKWVVSVTESGRVTVWNAESYEEATEFIGHERWVRAVDISPDGTRIATGADDSTVCVWSLSTGERLLRPLGHEMWVSAVKFSPNGHFIATATWCWDSVRIYDSQNGNLLINAPIRISSPYNHSLAWTSNSKQLFAPSRDGNINCVDVSTGRTLSRWRIHNSNDPTCIVLARNDRFIVASANSSISLWDTATHEQIGSGFRHTNVVVSMAISAEYTLVIGGGKTITLQNIHDMLPSSYFDDVSALASIHCARCHPDSESLFDRCRFSLSVACGA